MTTEQFTALAVLILIAVTVTFVWLVRRADAVDQRHTTQAYTGDALTAPAAPLSSVDAGGCAPPVLVGPPVASKQVLLIERCDDPFMWYAGMVGKEVPYLGEWKSEERFKSREPAGYINVVKFSDARIITKEPA